MSNPTKAPSYAYLAEKEPSSLHHALKAFIEAHDGPEVDIKTIQAVLSAHGTFQKSDFNKNREDYKPRTPQSIYKGGVTTAQNFHFVVDEDGVEVRVEGPAPEPKKVAPKPKAAPKAATKAPTPKAITKAPEPKAAPAKTARRPRKTVATATA